jgi:hypothetical protein
MVDEFKEGHLPFSVFIRLDSHHFLVSLVVLFDGLIFRDLLLGLGVLLAI